MPLREGGQRVGEEGVKAGLSVEFEGEPAAAPLAGMVEGKLIQPDADDALIVGGRGAVMREEGDL